MCDNKSWVCPWYLLGRQEPSRSCTGGGTASTVKSCWRLLSCNLMPQLLWLCIKPMFYVHFRQHIFMSICLQKSMSMELGTRAQPTASQAQAGKGNPLKFKSKACFLSMPHLTWDHDENEIWPLPEWSRDAHIWLLRRISGRVQLFNVKRCNSFIKSFQLCLTVPLLGRHFLQERLCCASWLHGGSVAAFMTWKIHCINSLDQTEWSLVCTFYRPWKTGMDVNTCCLKQSCRQWLWSIILSPKSRINIFINIAWIFLFVPTQLLPTICSFVIFPQIEFNSEKCYAYFYHYINNFRSLILLQFSGDKVRKKGFPCSNFWNSQRKQSVCLYFWTGNFKTFKTLSKGEYTCKISIQRKKRNINVNFFTILWLVLKFEN